MAEHQRNAIFTLCLSPLSPLPPPRAKSRPAGNVISELEELSEQYEEIMEDCGHGRFQWTLFIVLGLALMADGVECFVVAFVLPSAEKDLCMSNAEKGMLGK